ncbi:hypothetical protein [Pedobacter puniceum]|uniref:Uncharacterized protein n=1 Tax=Pedobacter puniceum TaxID=2666136 RepID=A0A7K0FR64_9SPHI|nr:hypothetical protein [Pedobacter puniceum]MRX48489.1 hypothetical protein [Pedobacter puniceum]
MKLIFNFKITIIIFLAILFTGLKVWAQPMGATISNPIQAGTLTPGVTYPDTNRK